jgi:hypothetical protein
MTKTYIYESPDKGKTVYRREFGCCEKELIQGEFIDAQVTNYSDRGGPRRRVISPPAARIPRDYRV